MENEISEIIRKNLPEQVGKILKDRLEYLEGIESDHKQISKMQDQLQDRIRQLKTQIEEKDELLARHATFDEREKIISARENKMDIHDARTELENERQKITLMERVLNTAFKSPIYRSTYNHNVNRTDYAENGDYMPQSGKILSEEKSTTTEEV